MNGAVGPTSDARVVVFRIGEEQFAVRAAAVQEILDGLEPVRVPVFPDHILGVVSHRSGWLVVLDPARALGTEGDGTRSVAIVLSRGRVSYALAVDEVLATEALAAGKQAMGTGAETLDGMTSARVAGRLLATAEGLVTLFDPDDLFENAIPTGWEEDVAMATDASATTTPVVSFAVGEDRYAITVDQVQEVIPDQELRSPDGLPAFVSGVLSLRGAELPVLDLRSRFGTAISASAADTRILIVEVRDHRFGFIVDSVSEVHRLSADRVTRTPKYLRPYAPPYVQGIARVDDHLIVLLKADGLIAEDELAAVNEADRRDGGVAPG